jgi:hypothetical protein
MQMSKNSKLPARKIVYETPISKIIRAKWTGGVAQTVEHLLCKQESLSPTKKTQLHKKKKKNHFWIVILCIP